jgi:hypothetical protein
MANSGQGKCVLSINRAQAVAFRLAKHYLRSKAEYACEGNCGLEPGESHVAQTERVFRGSQIVQVVRAISGVQAQVASAVSLALRARIQSLWPQDVSHALWSTKDLVKTWCMRATLHYLPSEDLPLYIAGLGPGIALKEQRWMAKDGLDEGLLERMVGAVVEALSYGPLTRREIASRVVARIGEVARPWVEHSWGGVIKQACLRGLVCFGPDQGREVAFVRLDQWLSGSKGFMGLSDRKVRSDDRIWAAAKVFERYVSSYGPATVQDFAFWSGLPVKDAAEARCALGDKVLEVMVDGTPALMLEKDLELLVRLDDDGQNAGQNANVNLLGCFDPFLLGHRDKSQLVDEEQYKKVFRKAGWISPVILVDGKVAGTWEHIRAGKRLCVVLSPFDGALRVSGGICEMAVTMDMKDELKLMFEDEVNDIRRFFGFNQVDVIIE